MAKSVVLGRDFGNLHVISKRQQYSFTPLENLVAGEPFPLTMQARSTFARRR